MRLLLVPAFTELEWGIADELSGWADVATFDAPGVGGVELPDLDLDPAAAGGSLARWREATAQRGLEEADRRGWDRFVVAADSYGAPAAVRVAMARPGAVAGVALGHASLSHATVGDRPPVRGEIYAALRQLAQQGNESFVRYGIAQMTRGAISEEVAAEMIGRFPDMELVRGILTALGDEPEPIGDDLAALGLPMLLAKHEGCLARTDEGYADIVAAFPDARTVICAEACSSSPAFAAALREFCDSLDA